MKLFATRSGGRSVGARPRILDTGANSMYTVEDNYTGLYNFIGGGDIYLKLLKIEVANSDKQRHTIGPCTESIYVC